MNTTNEISGSGRRTSVAVPEGGGKQDQRQNNNGRRSTNWVGRYQLGPQEVAKIYSPSIRLIAVAIGIGMALATILYLVTPPCYRAIGTILVDELPFVQTGKPSDAETERQLVQTLILSIANRDMRLTVEKQLGLPPYRIAFAGLDKRLHLMGTIPNANVKVGAVRNSRLGSITAESQSPEFAAQVVNAILDQLDLYNQVGGRLKAIQTTLALSKTQADNMVVQLADVSAQRIKLEQENDQLENYLKQGLPLANYPVFAQDATLGNLKTQLFLVESEYKALAATSTRGQRLEGKASELKSLRNQLDNYAKKLKESLHSEYSIRLNQEKDLQESKKKAAEKLDDYAQESTRIAQSFGNPELMRKLLSEKTSSVTSRGDANMVVTVNHASPPVRPYAPLLVLYLFLGGALGGLIGFGIAAVTFMADHHLVSAGQIETRLGLSCLGVIPETPKEGRSSHLNAEGIGGDSLELGLLLDRFLSQKDRVGFRVMGWSPVSPEQRSSRLIAQLALMLVKEGKRVVVMDLHFENPMIAKLLDVTITRGLEQWLHSQEPLSMALNPAPLSSSGKLAVISPSVADRSLVEEIGRRPLASLMDSLSNEWDFVLIDAPCLLTDRSLEVALPLYSNLILSAEYHRTRMSELTQACSSGRSRQWRVMGVVITRAPRKAA